MGEVAAALEGLGPQCLMKGGAENSAKPLIQIKNIYQVKCI
jgi:hypothetical protein